MSNHKQSVEAIRAAVLDGRASQPDWDVGELCGRFLLSEAFVCPEEPPLLCLCQCTEAFGMLGELWLRPEDLRPLISDLKWHLEHSYDWNVRRRWLGVGPVINMGTSGKERGTCDPPTAE